MCHLETGYGPECTKKKKETSKHFNNLIITQTHQ